MAKTAKVKHNPLSNPRSRASKRQISPSINTDKSLKELSPAPQDSKFLAPRPSAGVLKRKSKGKVQKSSKQKQRDAKRQDRAAAVMEKMQVKIGQKVKKGKVIHDRKNDWGVVNGESRETRRQAVLGLSNEAVDGHGWQDIDEEEDQEGKMEEVVENGSMAVPVMPPTSEPSTNEEVPAAVDDETTNEEDKIT